MISAATGRQKPDTMTKMLHWVNHVLAPGVSKICPGATWYPAINLYEDSNSYCMVADLAGMAVDHIELDIDGGVLTLKGHRAPPRPLDAEGTVRVHLMEIDEGAFCRSIELPSDIGVDQMQASYRCGFLWVRMPKKN